MLAGLTQPVWRSDIHFDNQNTIRWRLWIAWLSDKRSLNFLVNIKRILYRLLDRFFGCCCCSFPGMMSHFLIDCHVYMSICLQQDRVTCQTCCCLSFMGRGVVDKILNVICFLVLSDDFFLRSFFVYIVYTVNSFGRNQIGAADDGRWPPYRLMSSFSRQTAASSSPTKSNQHIIRDAADCVITFWSKSFFNTCLRPEKHKLDTPILP